MSPCILFVEIKKETTMKLKLVKEHEYDGTMLPVDSIIEVEDEVAGQQLIDEGVAILFTKEVEVEEEVEAIKEEAKNLNTEIETKSLETKKENRNMNTLGKSIKDAMEQKAVTTYVGTTASEVLGIVGFDIGLSSKCRTMPINGNMNVVYSATKSTSAELPVVDITAEETENATSTPIAQYNAIPAKIFGTVKFGNEYNEDINSFSAFVTEELRRDTEGKLDKYILRGAFGGNAGLKGVIASTDSVASTVTLSAPTVAQLHTMINNVIPELQYNSMWVIAPATWAYLKGQLLTAANINAQLITDGTNKTLLGYPVKICGQLISTNPIVFGDFSKYVIGHAQALTVAVDQSAAFASDSTLARVSVRVAGGPACSKKTINGVTYGAFTYASA